MKYKLLRLFTGYFNTCIEVTTECRLLNNLINDFILRKLIPIKAEKSIIKYLSEILYFIGFMTGSLQKTGLLLICE